MVLYDFPKILGGPPFRTTSTVITPAIAVVAHAITGIDESTILMTGSWRAKEVLLAAQQYAVCLFDIPKSKGGELNELLGKIRLVALD